MGISLAALAALLKGNLENAIVASAPGGIEAQEARGQRDFVASCTLPIQCEGGTTIEQLEGLGIIYGNPVDDLFVEVQLPEGWKKVATEHSMHSSLLDNKGRKRAGIFYKAAFYDRRAGISLSTRYQVSVLPVGGYGNSSYDYETTPRIGMVQDGDGVIWQTDSISLGERDTLWAQLETWLQEHLPDYRDPLAYWD